MLAAAAVSAQPRDERSGRRGGPPGGPPGFYLMSALDANRDGKLSTREIEAAVAALQKLDKDKDGKLSPEEIGWPPRGGFPGGGFPGGRGGRFPGGGFGGPGGGFPGRGGFRGGFPGAGGGPPRRPDPDAEGSRSSGGGRSFFSAAELKGLDRNQDGKITKNEIPRGLRDLILGRLDVNKDGLVDKDELDRLATKKKQDKPGK